MRTQNILNVKLNEIMGGNRFRPYNEELKNVDVGADSISAQDHKGITNVNGITLIALVITTIVLLILAGVVLNLALAQSGIINNAEVAGKRYNKEEATEKINFKITNTQINKYAEQQRMPTLQELADSFCEDNEIEYVELTSKKTASLKKIQVNENESFFTKLKEYPYEFEINGKLELASIDGIKIATNEIDYSDSKNEILFTQKVTVAHGWKNDIEGPEIPSGTWLIFANMTAGDNVEAHSTLLYCTGCDINKTAPIVGGANHISGYYKGEKTNLTVRIYNDSTTAKEYTINYRILKLSDTY